MAKKKELRLYRLARIWLRSNPFKGLLIVGVIMFCLGLGLYQFLIQYDWGKIVINLVFTMFTTEGSMVTMVASKKSFWTIIAYVVAGNVFNILIDIFIANRLLHWNFFKKKFDWLSRQFSKLLKIIKVFWFKVISHIPFVKTRKSNQKNGFSAPFDYLQNTINGFHKNPSKAGYGAIMILGLTPRFIIVGGVGLAVFIIRLNKFGLWSWLVLFGGIVIRTSIELASLYGIVSFF